MAELTYRYPQDLVSSEKYHHIIFHICEQVKSSYKTNNLANGGETAYARDESNKVAIGGSFQNTLEKNYQGTKDIAQNIASSTIGQVTGGVLGAITPDALKTAGAAALNSLDSTITQAGNINFVRTVRRTTTTIGLYMPDTLNFVQSQGYQDLSLGNNPLTALFTGGRAVADTIKDFNGSGINNKEFMDQLAKNINPYFVNAIGNAFGDVGKAIAAAGQGFVANPMIEVLYSSPSLREFRYDFVFYPQSKKEAVEVQNIINLFSFHQAPEILPGSSGYFLVPPSEFDIEFHYNGSENVNIPKVSTCVLTSMDVDYAPNGWAAYQEGNAGVSELGGTGMPVGIKMSLSFKETSIVTKGSDQFRQFGLNLNADNSENRIGSAGGQSYQLKFGSDQQTTVAEQKAAEEDSRNISIGAGGSQG